MQTTEGEDHPQSSTTLHEEYNSWAVAEQNLTDRHRRVREANRAHHLDAKYNEGLNLYLGIPVVVLTLIVAAIPSKTWYSIAISLAIGIMAGLQTFLKINEKAEKHLAAARTYSALRKEIEDLAAIPRAARGDVQEATSKITDKLNQANDKSPSLSAKAWRLAKADSKADTYSELKFQS